MRGCLIGRQRRGSIGADIDREIIAGAQSTMEIRERGGSVARRGIELDVAAEISERLDIEGAPVGFVIGSSDGTDDEGITSAGEAELARIANESSASIAPRAMNRFLDPGGICGPPEQSPRTTRLVVSEASS